MEIIIKHSYNIFYNSYKYACIMYVCIKIKLITIDYVIIMFNNYFHVHMYLQFINYFHILLYCTDRNPRAAVRKQQRFMKFLLQLSSAHYYWGRGLRGDQQRYK